MSYESPFKGIPGRSLSREDVLILELLEKARARRDLDIIEAAQRARLPDDLAERDTNFSAILAQDAISLHQVMMRLNRRYRLPRFLGGTATRLDRGEITHSPRNLFFNNYRVSTSVLLNTPAEFADEATLTDGYIFETSHPERHSRKNPTVSIHRALSDGFTGEVVKKPWEYIIHTGGEHEGHPFSIVTGNALGEPGEYPIHDPNDERLLVPMGLLRLAQEELLK